MPPPTEAITTCETIPSETTDDDSTSLTATTTTPVPPTPDTTPISETLSLINSYRSLTPSPPRPEQYSDPLLLEVEVSELSDRVQVVENAQKDIAMSNVALQEAQMTIMSVQEEIKRRLSRLEAMVKALGPPCGQLNEGGEQARYLPTTAPLPVAPQATPVVPPTPTTPVALSAPPPLATTGTPVGPSTSSNASLTETPEPFPCKPPIHSTNALPSSEINQAALLPVGDALTKYSTLIYSSKVRTLAAKLAKESIFGDDVLIRCTVAGSRSFPALPVAELNYLKTVIFKQFPVYWNAKHEFEGVWKDCIDGLGQACKRLRSGK